MFATDAYSNAALNPAQVGAFSRSTDVHEGTLIDLNARAREPSIHPLPRGRELASHAPLLDVLAALLAADVTLGPIELVSVPASTPVDVRVNSGVIAAMRPHQAGLHPWGAEK